MKFLIQCLILALGFFSSSAFAEVKNLAFCSGGDVEGGGLLYYDDSGVKRVQINEGGMMGGISFNSEFDVIKRKVDGKCLVQLASKKKEGSPYFINLDLSFADERYQISSFNLIDEPDWFMFRRVFTAIERKIETEEVKEIPLPCKFNPDFKKQLMSCED